MCGERDARLKLLDMLLAASVAWWGAATVCRMAWSGISLAGVCAAAIHGFVAIAFLFRSPPRATPLGHGCLAAVPSLATGSLASQLAGPSLHWPLGSHVLFGMGALLAAIAICQLGRSFAVLPHGRPLVTRGVYRLLRHPMYLGELLMVAACCSARMSVCTMALLILALPAIAWRITTEESQLQRFDARGFDEYVTVARWRLFPMIW